MKNYLFGIICLFLLPAFAHAQLPELCNNNQDRLWNYGFHAILDFNNPQPHVNTLSSSVNAQEGSATVSDPNGNLLFYTDGIRVYDGNNQLKNAGNWLAGGPSATHAAVAVPHPGNRSIFYIFTTDDTEIGSGVGNSYKYSVYNLSIGANGGVQLPVNRNIYYNGVPFPFQAATEKLAVVSHANCRDFWVIMHDFADQTIPVTANPDNGLRYIAYQVNLGGFNPFQTPTISVTGTRHAANPNDPLHYNHRGRIGQLSVSADQSKIATAIQDSAIVEISNFDRATGQVSTYLKLDIEQALIDNYPNLTISSLVLPYGVEFSPSGQHLFVTATDGSTTGTRGWLLRFDLTAANIQNSITDLAMDVWGYGQIKRGPDGKMYVAHGRAVSNPTNQLIVITNPDQAVPTVTSIVNSNCRRGLTYTIPDYCTPSVDVNDIALNCGPDSAVLSANTFYNGVPTNTNHLPFSYLWDNNSTVNPRLVFSGATTNYSVTVTDANGCTASDNAVVTVSGSGLPVSINGPSNICEGSAFTMGAFALSPNNIFQYNWDTGPLDIFQSVTVNGLSPGTYTYNVTVTDVQSGCSGQASHQVTVHANPQAHLLFGPNDEVCPGTSIVITAVPDVPGTFTYQWSNGLGSSQTITHVPTGTTNYSVTVTDAQGCSTVLSQLITVWDAPQATLSATPPGKACLGENLSVTANVTGGTPAYSYNWTWNNGASSGSGNPLVSAPLVNTTYKVTVTDANGCVAMQELPIEVQQCCPAQGSPEYDQVNADLVLMTGTYHLWPDKVYVADNVTVVVTGSGTVLDVTNSDIVFGPCARILVQNGGRIIANNSVFRPCEESKTWKGVEFGRNDFLPEVDATPSGSFKECTFINAGDGILLNKLGKSREVVEIDITNNLFLNCRFGTRIMHRSFNGAITGNTYKIDEAVASLTYCGKDVPETGFTGISINNENPFPDFYAISHPNLISHNNFVNGFAFYFTGTQQFDGIHLFGANATNVSSNHFTNNTRSIVMVRPSELTVENNHMEVTRRSNADQASYQITFDGGQNGSFSSLIRNNTVINSAEVSKPSDIFNSDGRFKGTGAIYVTSAGRVDVESNEIDGFEVGIMIDKPKDAEGIRCRVVNNAIRTHIYGIYQRGYNSDAFLLTSFIGCNQIDMDRDISPSTGAIGYFLDLEGTIVSGDSSEDAPRKNVMLFGNCLRNASTAVRFEHYSTVPAVLNQTLPHLPRLENNYFHNFQDAGIHIRNFTGRIGQSYTFGTNYQAGRNTFISNRGLSAATFFYDLNLLDINANPIPGNVSSDRNDYAAIGTAILGGNFSTVPGAQFSFNGGTYYPSVSSCGNQDAGLNIDQTFTDYCDDDKNPQFSGTPITQRNSATGTWSIHPDFEANLRLEASEGSVMIASLVREAIALLSASDADRIVRFVRQQGLLSPQEEAWMDYELALHDGDYSFARSLLAGIVPESITESDRKTIQEILLELSSADGSMVNIAPADLDRLREIDGREGLHAAVARDMLHGAIGGYHYRYPGLKAPEKTAVNPADLKVLKPNHLTVYPNPAQSEINIDFHVGGDLNGSALMIYDAQGRLVRQLDLHVNASKATVDIGSFSRGIYMVTLRNGQGILESERFVKQ